MVPLKRSNNHRPPPNVSEATSEVPLDRPYLASRKILTNISEEMLHFGWSGWSLYIILHPHKQTEILENWYLKRWHVLQSLRFSNVLEECPDGTCGKFRIYMFCCKPITPSVTGAPSKGMKATRVTGFPSMLFIGIPLATCWLAKDSRGL